jgi:hypothetical protein
MNSKIANSTRANPYLKSTRPFSAKVLDGPERAPSRAMLYPVGFRPEDFAKPMIGIASAWSMVTPCNMHLDQLACEAEAGANAAGGKAIIFDTITISDGISMGTEGMKYSLVSREIIADSIETVVGCEGMDGFVAIGGCDKNMPGSLIAMARLNRPAVFAYGGTILPGCIAGEQRNLDIVSVFEAVGAHAKRRIDDQEFQAIESCAIPGPGACGGMYTANTMASAIEALGMSLHNSSAQNAISEAKKDDCRRAGATVVEMIKRGLRPLDIMTKRAFENAITVVISLGGSTNAVLHLLAIAHACKVKLALDDFTRIGRRDYPDKLRRVRLYDTEHTRSLVFLTNHFGLPALMIAQLYRQRWQVELFFKWLKQHLRIKAFYGRSENAVRTQLWVALCVYALVAIVRKQVKSEASLFEILQVLSVRVFDKTPVGMLFCEAAPQSDSCDPQKHLCLWA